MERPPVLLYRIGYWFFVRKMFFIAKIITWTNRMLFATFIPSSAKIGKNFKPGYLGLGIVIHKNAIIGSNCTIGQNVTIGKNLGDQDVPIIGNNVYIGAGSVIFGEIEIGDNSIIGANSVVTRSIPSNKVAFGNPAKIIKEKVVDYEE